MIRFSFIAPFALAMSAAVSVANPNGVFKELVPASAAAVLVVTYLRKPAEALLGIALVVLFYDTIALHLPANFKQFDEMAVGSVFLIAAWRARRDWRSWGRLLRDVAIIVALGLAVVSSLVASVPVEIWLPSLMLVGKPLAFLYATIWTPFRSWELKGGVLVVAACACLVFAIGIVELLFPTSVQSLLNLPDFTQSRGSLPVVKSVFVHPALFGWFMALSALFLFAAYLVTHQLRWLIFALVFSLGPILSARRRAILAMGTGLLGALVASMSRLRSVTALIRAWLPVALGIGVLLVFFMPVFVGLYQVTLDRYVRENETLPPVVSPGPDALPPATESDGTPQARVALYLGSLEVARDYAPLGAGLGRYASWMSRVNYSPLYEEYGLSTIRGLRPTNPIYVTDTFWPQILGEFGIVGVLGYLAFLAAIGLDLWRETMHGGDRLLQFLRFGALMVFGQALAESLASTMFHSPPRVYLLYFAVGLVLSVSWRMPSPRVPGNKGRLKPSDL